MQPSSALPNDTSRPTDVAAMARFIQGHRLQLLAYIRKHLGPARARKGEAEDVLQGGAREALRGGGELPKSDRDRLGWLCQIPDSRLVDIHRRYFSAQKRAA